ncbi:hypothetical protein CDEN61S_02979 [Castellaniella denitrificans]|uniref:DUF2848 domain-containing protein n=1 Tax=Castellaniella sp. TaxID=1955812 RepID=UPI002AFFE492|nr:DUF2848 domain-containing protein [Castellaniella sp.]
MKLFFDLISAQAAPQLVAVELRQCIVAGWAGRDLAAIEHHIEELAALGVPRPSAVPLYYRIAANQVSQDGELQAVGPHSSGEAEVFIFMHDGRLMVSLASDHTDRKLESVSVALSKQLCVKPVARAAWPFEEVAAHWDALILRSWIEEDGQRVLYQEGALASLRPPAELIEGCFGPAGMPAGAGMTCGTMAAIGGIRPSTSFEMELFDPILDRRIRHAYRVEVLPEVA